MVKSAVSSMSRPHFVNYELYIKEATIWMDHLWKSPNLQNLLNVQNFNTSSIFDEDRASVGITKSVFNNIYQAFQSQHQYHVHVP